MGKQHKQIVNLHETIDVQAEEIRKQLADIAQLEADIAQLEQQLAANPVADSPADDNSANPAASGGLNFNAISAGRNMADDLLTYFETHPGVSNQERVIACLDIINRYVTPPADTQKSG